MADIGVPLSPGQISGPLPPSLAYGAALFRLRYAALRNGVNYQHTDTRHPAPAKWESYTTDIDT